jgi:hypothetical protein
VSVIRKNGISAAEREAKGGPFHSFFPAIFSRSSPPHAVIPFIHSTPSEGAHYRARNLLSLSLSLSISLLAPPKDKFSECSAQMVLVEVGIIEGEDEFGKRTSKTRINVEGSQGAIQRSGGKN